MNRSFVLAVALLSAACSNNQPHYNFNAQCRTAHAPAITPEDLRYITIQIYAANNGATYRVEGHDRNVLAAAFRLAAAAQKAAAPYDAGSLRKPPEHPDTAEVHVLQQRLAAACG